MSELTKNLHVPLPESIYGALRSEARKVGRPVTQVAREAIRRWLEARRKARIEQALEAYVDQVAGTRDDLDPDLEQAGLECLQDVERPRRKRHR